jgi:hypothetical protein
MQRPKISEVFTPRNAEVNDAMYIHRPLHETELTRAVEGSLHAVLCGESGSGKSWLQRHVAQKNKWKTFYANAGNAARYRTLTGTIANAIYDEDDREWIEYSQKLVGEIGMLGMKGATEAGRVYEVKSKELLLRAFKKAREKAGDAVAVVVIDNLEAIFKKADLMEELGNIILLLDDPDYATHRIKLLIVGVPAEVVEYYQRIENLETVANRLKEIPAVTGLNWGQVEDFVTRGFLNQLKIDLGAEIIATIAKYVAYVTLGIPQRLHEYCEILAFNIEDSEWRYDPGLLKKADEKFLNNSLRKAYAVLETSMNERRTKTGRRNQVLYALGKMSKTEFDAGEVESLVRSEFPVSTSNTTLAVGQMLGDLSAGDSPLLRRSAKLANYRFSDPRYLMCIRVVLQKTGDGEKVLKRTFRR